MDPKTLMSLIGPVMGMFGQNMTNNQNNQAQQNALNQAQQIMGNATGAAKNSLASWLGQNPNPASQWGQIQQPGQYGGGSVSMPGGPGIAGYQGGFQPGAPQQPVLPPGWGPPGISAGQRGGLSNPGQGRMMQGGPIQGRSPVMSLPIMLGGGGGNRMQGSPIQAGGQMQGGPIQSPLASLFSGIPGQGMQRMTPYKPGGPGQQLQQ